MTIKGAIVGHSFVNSLQDHLSQRSEFTQASPQHVAAQLRVSEFVSHIYIHWVKGGLPPEISISLMYFDN